LRNELDGRIGKETPPGGPRGVGVRGVKQEGKNPGRRPGETSNVQHSFDYAQGVAILDCRFDIVY